VLIHRLLRQAGLTGRKPNATVLGTDGADRSRRHPVPDGLARHRD
jgi:hypothetical protein